MSDMVPPKHLDRRHLHGTMSEWDDFGGMKRRWWVPDLTKYDLGPKRKSGQQKTALKQLKWSTGAINKMSVEEAAATIKDGIVAPPRNRARKGSKKK